MGCRILKRTNETLEIWEIVGETLLPRIVKPRPNYYPGSIFRGRFDMLPAYQRDGLLYGVQLGLHFLHATIELVF